MWAWKYSVQSIKIKLLLYKATTDSSLLDFSYYRQIINNVFIKGKLNKS